jgi:hypothetical protein
MTISPIRAALVAACASALLTPIAVAQTPSAATPSGQPGAAPAGSPPEAATPNPAAGAGPSKRAACRAAGQQQGLRGPDLADQIAICMAEARVECLKQAIAQKIPPGPLRQEFIKSCTAS